MNPLLSGGLFRQGTTQPTSDYERVLQELINSRKRLESAGYSGLAPAPESLGFLGRVFDILGRPIFGINNLIQEYVNKKSGLTPDQFDPLQALWRGFKGQEKTLGRDVLRSAGVDDTKAMFKLGKWEPTAASVYGTIMDMFNPADPLNWILPGIKAIPKGAAKSGIDLLSDILGAEKVAKWTKGLAPEVFAKFGQSAGPQSVGKLLSEFTELAFRNQMTKDPGRLTRNLYKLAQSRGFEAGRELTPNMMKRVKIGLQVPLINQKVGEVTLPGTEFPLQALSWLGGKLTDIPFFDQLAHAFSTTYTPKHVPSSVVLRGLAGEGVPVAQHGPGVFKEIREKLQEVRTTSFLRSEDEVEKVLLGVFEGVDLKQRKDIMEAVALGREIDLPTHLSPVASNYQKYLKSTIAWIKGYGLKVHELDPYVPFVVVGGPLKKGEAELIRGVYKSPLPIIDEAGSHLPIDPVTAAIKSDPHLKRRVTLAQAKSPREVNELLGRTWLADDPLVAGIVRGRHAITAQEMAKVAATMTEKYGLKYEEMMAWAKAGHVLPGYVAVMMEDSPIGRMKYKVSSGITEGMLTDPNLDLRFMPEEFVQLYNDYSELYFDSRRRSQFERYFDEATSWFRTVAYLWNWGHLSRDSMGNIFNAWQGDLRNISRYGESSARLWRGLHSYKGQYTDMQRFVERMVVGLPAAPGEEDYLTLFHAAEPDQIGQSLRKGIGAEFYGSTDKNFIQRNNPNTPVHEVVVKARLKRWNTPEDKLEDLNQAMTARYSTELTELGMKSWDELTSTFSANNPELQAWEQSIKSLNLSKDFRPTDRVSGITPSGEFIHGEVDLTSVKGIDLVRVNLHTPNQFLSLESPSRLTTQQLDSITRMAATSKVPEIFITSQDGTRMRFLLDSLLNRVGPEQYLKDELYPLSSLEQVVKFHFGGSTKASLRKAVQPKDLAEMKALIERADPKRVLVDYLQGYNGVVWGSPEQVFIFDPGSVRTAMVSPDNPTFGPLGLWDQRVKVKTEDGSIREMDDVTLLSEARRMHVIDVGPSTAETVQRFSETQGSRLGKAVSGYTNVMAGLTKTGDNVTRMALFLDRIHKGDTLAQAAVHVKKWLFDYFDLTPFERRRMRQIIPFYTWLRKNLPIQIESLFTKPGKLATMGKIHRNISEPYTTEDVPSYVEEGAGILLRGQPGSRRFLMPNLPYADLSKIPAHSGQLRELFGSINPLIRILPETLLNTQFFSGKPIERYPGETQPMPFLGQGLLGGALQKAGINAPQINRRFIGYPFEQAPFFRNLNIMQDPSNPKWVPRVTSFLGGPPSYEEEKVSKAAAYEERERLRAVIRKLKDLGIDIENTSELKRNNLLGQLEALGIQISPNTDLDNLPPALRAAIRRIKEGQTKGG